MTSAILLNCENKTVNHELIRGDLPHCPDSGKMVQTESEIPSYLHNRNFENFTIMFVRYSPKLKVTLVRGPETWLT